MQQEFKPVFQSSVASLINNHQENGLKRFRALKIFLALFNDDVIDENKMLLKIAAEK